ncbi:MULTISPECIES: vWA domain-containing protein [Streptacidiphilus]|uniref:VWA domain-containing protein n=1 Tax=Streptacidiphilus cavernicola TaxID=3342716 RepID=A0ABV6ULX5_9ACTN|nr:vWA domain-containing protein [Streptacidiphilus jeojiense]
MTRYRVAAVLTALLLGTVPLSAQAQGRPLAAGASPAATATAGTATATAADQTIGPINYSIAVDESGSISAADMAAERDAATRIALGDISSTSQVSVFGFASADNASERPVDTDCTPTQLDAAGRDRIGSCSAKLQSRSAAQGQGTDFPNAIRQGISYLTQGTDPSTPRVLFVLTDGKLDVSTSPEYGDTAAHRQAAGQQQLIQVLAQAAADHIQVWSLGFGPAQDLDRATLTQMAAGGYQNGCVDLPDARPRATEVSDSTAVGSALETAFAAAHCLRRGSDVHGYPPTDLTVQISALATTGSIVVSKGDPAVTVSYFDPDGNQIHPGTDANGSSYELAGSGQLVESLRITDPMPGPWRIHLDAPSGHRGKLATAGVLWRGELRGSVTLDPPSPLPGQRAVATLRLETRLGYSITDPGDYAGLQVSAELTGDGFTPVPVPLADNGAVPDAKAGDASFSGYVTIPRSASGALKMTGTLTAVGLTAESGITAPGWIGAPTALVSADLTIAGGAHHPGDRINGSLAVHNGDSSAHTLLLSVPDVDGGLLTFGPDRLVLAPGATGTRTVTLVVGPRGAFGNRLGGSPLPLGATPTVIDSSDHGRVLASPTVSLTLTPRPGLWQQLWWAFVGAAVLVLLAGALLVAQQRYRRRRIAADGLRITLISGEGKELGTYTARSGPKGWFEFDIEEPTRPFPRIRARAGGAYAVRGSVDGAGVLRIGNNVRIKLSVGVPEPLEHGLSLRLGEPSGSVPEPDGSEPNSYL